MWERWRRCRAFRGDGSVVPEQEQELIADVIKNQAAIGIKTRKWSGGDEEMKAVHSLLNVLPPVFPDISTCTNKADIFGKSAPQLKEV